MPNLSAIGSFSGEFNMKNIPNSDWRTIPGFPKYAVTPDGQIWSYYTNKFLKPCPDRRGYLIVGLCNDLGQSTWKVHRLVGEAFVPLPPEFNGNYDIATIDHIDGNKLNNHYTNLEWVTPEENIKRAWENGLCDNRKKEYFCISIEDEKYTPFDSARSMDRSLNLPEGTVIGAINNANGIIQGKYIVGYTEDLDKKYLLPEPDVDGIIELYSDTIANYTPNKIPCFYIDSLDNSYHKSDSISDIDKKIKFTNRYC